MLNIRTAKELYSIYTETTVKGVFRYIYYKVLSNQNTLHMDSVLNDLPVRGLGIIGAGVYVASIHLPILRYIGVPIAAIASASGKTAAALAKIYKIQNMYHDFEAMLTARQCDALLIATPHYLHPQQIALAAKFELYTYCEKPVAIDEAGIDLLTEQVDEKHFKKVMIGFNRRFAPAICRLLQESWISARHKPIEIQYRVNYGPRVLNAMSDKNIGGGRLLGAACHYVDLIAFIAKSSIKEVSCMSICYNEILDSNTFVSIFCLLDGSIASLIFSSEGSRDFDVKEEIKISCDGHVAMIKDFKSLYIDGKCHNFFRNAYGALDCMRSFIDSKNKKVEVPVTLSDGMIATKVTLAMQKSIENNGKPVAIK